MSEPEAPDSDADDMGTLRHLGDGIYMANFTETKFDEYLPEEYASLERLLEHMQKAARDTYQGMLDNPPPVPMQPDTLLTCMAPFMIYVSDVHKTMGIMELPWRNSEEENAMLDVLATAMQQKMTKATRYALQMNSWVLRKGIRRKALTIIAADAHSFLVGGVTLDDRDRPRRLELIGNPPARFCTLLSPVYQKHGVSKVMHESRVPMPRDNQEDDESPKH